MFIGNINSPNTFLYLLFVLVFISYTLQSDLTLNSEANGEDGEGDEDEDGEEKRLLVNKTFRSGRFSNTSYRFTSRESTPVEPYVRLSSSLFKPIRYHVYWDLTGGIETFSGTVRISFKVLSSTRSLAIQVSTLNISSLSLHYQDNQEKIIVERSWLDKSDVYIIETRDNVTQNATINMFIKFTGTFQTLGFLVHQSTTPVTRYTYMTKFEPIHARKAFPCFDEPDMKAYFKISVKHNSSLKAYSNMPLESVRKDDSEAGNENWLISEFQESPLMTTYLVALVVCDCHRSVATTSQGIEIGIITLKDDVNKTDYSLSITVKCMEFFHHYLGIEYKFPKLDIFAAPHYPSFGMEHSGLIIQFYDRILYQKDGDYEVYSKEWVLYTTAHEIAHQWFGNLVTLRWWEHTWLNEGFATYFATKAVEHVDPGMYSDDLFIINRYRTSLLYDLRGIYNPWNRTIAPITHFNQIKQSFSWLSYQKGGSILRMMEDFLGSDLMAKLMRSYLAKHADSNVVTRDFSNEVGKYYSEVNMTEFIDSWTKQSGCPIVTVIWTNNGTVRLNQVSSLTHKSSKENSKNSESQETLINSTNSERSSPHIFSSSTSSTSSPSSFSSSRSNKFPNESSITWLIPITYKTSDGFSGLIWLTQASQEYKLCDNCSWIVFNVNKKGYYVVNYSSSQWSTLIDALNNEPESFPSETYTSLLLDAYHLCDLGLVPVETFFGVLSNVKRYSTLAPLSLALTMSKVTFGAPAFGEGRYLLYEYRRDLLESIYEKVPMIPKATHEDYAKMILRFELLEDACEMKVPDCLKDASKLLLSWITNETYIPNYLQNVVFRYGMPALNNFTYWETILTNLLTGNLKGIKGTALIRGLFAIKEDNLREKAYSLLKDTEYEIEASVLIESKCPTISTSKTLKISPLKNAVLKWLMGENLYGFPWRYEPKNLPVSIESIHDEVEPSSQQGTSNSPIKPFHYSLNLLFLPKPSMMVKGSLDLTFTLNGPTKHCILHIGSQLTVSSVSVYSINLINKTHRKQLVLSSFHYRRHNLFIIQFQTYLEPGNYSIHLTYAGNYSAAQVKGYHAQTQPTQQSQSYAHGGSSSMSSEAIELQGGIKLFPTFNHSLDSPPSFTINLVYRLTSDDPLHFNSIKGSSSTHHHEGATIIHSAATVFIDILPSQLKIYLSPESVRLTYSSELIDVNNETSALRTSDNSV